MNRKLIISCVILHYNTIKDTEKCISSILNIANKSNNYEVKIIIVDNNSKNNTGKILKEEYENKENIYCIINSENLGFSAGNNIGFKYAKHNLKSDFIVLFNNDTYIINDNFFDEIIESYEKKQWAVMGPKIQLKDGTYNPINLREITPKRVEDDILYYKKMIKFYHMHFYNIYAFARNIKNRIVKNIKPSDVNKEYYNILLHGCCWIFSNKYIQLFDGLDEKTFMYAEEELLLLKLKKNKLINYYNPKILIGHSEYSSTKTVQNFNLYRYENLIKANEVLLKEIQETKNE